MPDIDVKGIGVLSFPDDMSEKDIEKAIKEHPEYEKARNVVSSENTTPKWVRDFIGPPENVPSGKTFVREVGKGVPLAKHYIDQTPEMTKMEKEWPWTTTGARLTGTLGSTLPLVAATGGLTGPALLPSIAGQSALGAGIAGADTLAEKGKNVTAQDLKTSMVPGALWGGSGPIAGKVLSPGTYAPPIKPIIRPTPSKPPPFERPTVESIRARSRLETGVDQGAKSQLDSLIEGRYAATREAMARQAQAEREAAQQAARQATEDRLRNLAPRMPTPSTHNDSIRDILLALAGGGAAHVMGASPFMTMAAATAGAVGPHVPAIGAKYAHNTMMQQPGTRDILNALMTSQGIGQ